MFLLQIAIIYATTRQPFSLHQGFKKTRFFKSPTQRVFGVLTGFIELWVFLGFFPIDKWVVPSRDSLDRMHLALLTALLVVSFVV